MPADIALTASVTRSALGLSNLNINDKKKYNITATMLGGGVSWQKQQVSSPYVDGDVTVTRRRPTVMEPLEIYVYGKTGNELTNNIRTLIDAFIQDTYNLLISIDGSTRQYKCECADYTIEYANTKFASGMTMVRFNVPRNPIPTVGV
jgi:hypothetical protein